MRHIIVLPDLGQTTTEAKVLQWHKQPGERVSRGEPLLAVETDKVDMDVESFADGYLRRILVEPGAMAVALKPVGIVTDSPQEPYDDSPEPVSKRHRVAATPAAKALARELGLGVEGIPGGGRNGLVVRADVENLIRNRAQGDTRGRSAMASLVTAAKREIPHFYASFDCDMTAAEAWRREWNARHSDLHVSWNEIFVRCAAGSLRDLPELNTRLDGGRYITARSNDLLVVVASESGLSLIEIREPDGSGWEPYLRQMKTAIQKRSRAVKAANTDGARPLLAVSNLGMFGVKEFAAIIPPGCTAALAVGAIRDTPVVREGRLDVGKICTLTLSADHRIVDGVTAARFLQRMQAHLDSL